MNIQIYNDQKYNQKNKLTNIYYYTDKKANEENHM